MPSAVDGRLDAGVEVPAVGVVDEVEQVVELGIAALAVFVAADRLDDVGRAGGDVFLHAELGIEFELLRQITDAQGAAQGDFPGVRHLLAGEDFQQRGFAAAVAADHADFLPGGDGEGDAVEQRLVTVGQADFVGGEESGHEAARLVPYPGRNVHRGCDFPAQDWNSPHRTVAGSWRELQFRPSESSSE